MCQIDGFRVLGAPHSRSWKTKLCARVPNLCEFFMWEWARSTVFGTILGAPHSRNWKTKLFARIPNLCKFFLWEWARSTVFGSILGNPIPGNGKLSFLQGSQTCVNSLCGNGPDRRFSGPSRGPPPHSRSWKTKLLQRSQTCVNSLCGNGPDRRFSGPS